MRRRSSSRFIGVIRQRRQIRKDTVGHVALDAAFRANLHIALHAMQNFDRLAALQLRFYIEAAERFVDPHAILIRRALHVCKIARKNRRCQPQGGQRQEKSNATHVPSFAPKQGLRRDPCPLARTTQKELPQSAIKVCALARGSTTGHRAKIRAGQEKAKTAYERQRSVTGPVTGWRNGWPVRNDSRCAAFNSKYQRA